MKNRMLPAATALVLPALLGKFYAAPAIAQTVRAVLVKNIDEKGRNPYFEKIACAQAFFGACNTAINTIGTSVPAGMQFVVENINLDIAATH